MPREKKDYKNLNIKLARPIYITKTMATERILDRYFKEYFSKEKEERRLI